MEDSSHEFLTNRWFVHSQFVGLDNPLEVVVHHLIRGTISLGYQDEFSIMSALVCMVTHWTRSIVSHDLRLSSGYCLTKLLHYVVYQPWENIEFVLKLAMVLTYGWDHKLIIYSLWIGLLLMKSNNNRYFQ